MTTAVFVHGAGGGGWEWRLWAGVFASEGWQVLAPDLMATSQGLIATGLDDYRDQVLAWMDAVPGRCCLLGASLGGLLALAAASLARRPPCALVLVNPVPPAGMPRSAGWAPRPALVYWSQLSFERTRAALPDASLDTARWVHARWRDESGLALNQASAGWPPGQAGLSLACPSLVLASGDDTDVPVAESRHLAGRIGADFSTIVECSHLGILLGRSAAAAARQACSWLDGHRVCDDAEDRLG